MLSTPAGQLSFANKLNEFIDVDVEVKHVPFYRG